MGKSMYELKDKLCEELDEIAERGTVDMSSLEKIYKLTTSIKNIDKIAMAERSRDGDWSANGTYSRDYSRDYDREGSYRRRDSMGRFSRGGDMVDRLEQMMEEAQTDKERDAIRKCLNQMR